MKIKEVTNINYNIIRAKKYNIEDKKETCDKFPKNALVELTNECNHACLFCYNTYMNRSRGEIRKEVFERFVREACDLGLEEIGLYGTGEPFLVKELNWFIRSAKDAGAKRVYLSTNGSLATVDRVISAVENGLDSIKFSINASTPDSYKLIHGKNHFDRVIRNLRNIYQWKKENSAKLQILGSFIFTKYTVKEAEMFRSKYGEYFDDIICVQALNQGGRIGEIVGKFVDKKEMERKRITAPCHMLWNRIHLTWEGYLTACCVDYENDMIFGDYNSRKPIMELWNSETMIELRKKHLSESLDGLICSNCCSVSNEEISQISENRDIKTVNNVTQRKNAYTRIEKLKKLYNKIEE